MLLLTLLLSFCHLLLLSLSEGMSIFSAGLGGLPDAVRCRGPGPALQSSLNLTDGCCTCCWSSAVACLELPGARCWFGAVGRSIKPTGTLDRLVPATSHHAWCACLVCCWSAAPSPAKLSWPLDTLANVMLSDAESALHASADVVLLLLWSPA